MGWINGGVGTQHLKLASLYTLTSPRYERPGKQTRPEVSSATTPHHTFTSVVSENLFQKTKMDLGNEKLHV